MADIMPSPLGHEVPPALTEIEQVEIASALSFHFEAHPECRGDLEDQYTAMCVVVERMIRRRIASDD